LLVLKKLFFFLIYKENIFLGLFIYACRLHLTLSNTCDTYNQQAAITAVGNDPTTEFKQQGAACKGGSGDCA